MNVPLRQANNALRTPHEFYLWEDPEDPDGALLWISTPTSSANVNNANLLIADISGVLSGGSPTLSLYGSRGLPRTRTRQGDPVLLSGDVSTLRGEAHGTRRDDTLTNAYRDWLHAA